MDHTHLRNKGWSEEELDHAHKVLVHANKEWPHTTHKHWVITLIGFLGVIIFALYLTPLILLLPALGAYPLTILVGVLFAHTLTQAYKSFHYAHHHIKGHHHISVQTILPITAVLSLVLFLTIANNYSELPVVFSQTHHPLLIGLLFGLGVLLPYRHYHATTTNK